MRSSRFLLLIFTLVTIVAGMSWANPGRTELLGRLAQTLQIDDSYDIGYQFKYSYQAGKSEERGEHSLRMLRNEGKDYLFAELERPVKIFFAERTTCQQYGAAWLCSEVDAKRFAHNVRSQQMGLHPLTASYLLHRLLKKYPQAAMVSARPEQYISGRYAACYDVIVDPTALPRAQFNELLYFNLKQEGTAAKVTGTQLSLCFDQISNHLLGYNSRMQTAQSSASTELVATRFNAFPPSEAEFYAVPE